MKTLQPTVPAIARSTAHAALVIWCIFQLTGCESAPSPQSVATDRLIGRWEGRLDIEEDEEDKQSDPSFPDNDPRLLKAGRTVFHFKYNDALEIENYMGDLVAETLGNWHVVDVDAETVTLQIGTRERISESQPVGKIVLLFKDEDHFTLTRTFGKYASSYERMKKPSH